MPEMRFHHSYGRPVLTGIVESDASGKWHGRCERLGVSVGNLASREEAQRELSAMVRAHSDNWPGAIEGDIISRSPF